LPSTALPLIAGSAVATGISPASGASGITGGLIAGALLPEVLLAITVQVRAWLTSPFVTTYRLAVCPAMSVPSRCQLYA
jgi:hypothetical protein